MSNNMFGDHAVACRPDPCGQVISYDLEEIGAVGSFAIAPVLQDVCQIAVGNFEFLAASGGQSETRMSGIVSKDAA